MIVFYHSDLDHGQVHLTPDQSKHCIKVLRKKLNDQIVLVDGKGTKVIAKILDPNAKKVICLLESRETQMPPLYKRAIGIAPTKQMSRYEWFLEKATEVGITHIYPIIFKHSERKNIKTERLEKILISALKQSLRYHLPILEKPMSFKQFISDHSNAYSQKFIANYDPNNPDLKNSVRDGLNAIVLIGPEGDFHQSEIESAIASGFKAVNLSENRLRTETAGLAALMQII